MNRLFFAMLCFLTFTSNAQNFIETLKGERFDNIDLNTLELFESVVEFEYNGKKEKFDIDKISKADLGDYKIESLKLGKRKKSLTYFVFAESENKKLVCRKVEYINQDQNVYGQNNNRNVGRAGIDHSFSNVKYFIYLLDNDNNILKEYEIHGTSNRKKDNELRGEAEQMIRDEFKDCEKVIARLEKYNLDNSDMEVKSKWLKKKLEKAKEANFIVITSFLNEKKYTNCN